MHHVEGAIPEAAGPLPGVETDLELDGDQARLLRTRHPMGGTRGQEVVRRLRGSATMKMSTDEALKLMRGG